MIKVDTGDTVKHLPSGETWIVACVENGELSWVGWPEGWAKLADCVLVKKATAEKRQKILEQMAGIRNAGDHRRAYAIKTIEESGRKVNFSTTLLDSNSPEAISTIRKRIKEQ